MTGKPPQDRHGLPPSRAAARAPDAFAPPPTDPQQTTEVARWRKSERRRLLAARGAMRVADRQAASAALATHLADLIAGRWGGAGGRVLSAFWPIKGEPDLRALMAALHGSGVIIALPVVETKAAPLAFRLWTPETRMVRGDWNIPVPPDTAERVQPEIALAPLVGWAEGGWRLGYGGGYFDRTLASLSPRPVSIGIGFGSSRLQTIFPQPHDIPLDIILAENGVAFDRTAR
ncbi:MAG: 5-formyltetrahydrofolate cyclo-ligase [Rhodobacteraceae bacterium]|nr:5-formyltetrahydrofolate cyclo-ligase [Paracoccaceae bacterium]